MKKVLWNKTSFIMGGWLLFVCACSNPKPRTEKGPQQQPFQHCDAEDSECEEGASSDVLNHAEEMQIVQEASSVVFVTPVVVDPVHVEKSNSELAITITAEQPDNTPKEQ